jgi:hypothetical protein
MTKYGHVYRDLLDDLCLHHRWSLGDIEAIDGAVRRRFDGQSEEQIASRRDVGLLRLLSFLQEIGFDTEGDK